jgi:hypothetical protein
VTDSNVFQLSQPGTLCDPLTEVLRSGARALSSADHGANRRSAAGAPDRAVTEDLHMTDARILTNSRHVSPTGM